MNSLKIIQQHIMYNGSSKKLRVYDRRANTREMVLSSK